METTMRRSAASSKTAAASLQSLTTKLRCQLLGIPFFQAIKARILLREEVRPIFFAYANYCQEFPSILEKIIERSQNSIFLNSLKENLGEEVGPPSHHQLYQRFLNSLGEPLTDLSMQDQVTQYLKIVREFILNASELQLMGFIGPGTEAVTSEQYELFFQYFIQFEDVQRADLEFFEMHIAVDEKHSERIWHAIESSCMCKQDFDEVASGLKVAIGLESNFWCSLFERTKELL